MKSVNMQKASLSLLLALCGTGYAEEGITEILEKSDIATKQASLYASGFVITKTSAATVWYDEKIFPRCQVRYLFDDEKHLTSMTMDIYENTDNHVCHHHYTFVDEDADGKIDSLEHGYASKFADDYFNTMHTATFALVQAQKRFVELHGELGVSDISTKWIEKYRSEKK